MRTIKGKDLIAYRGYLQCEEKSRATVDKYMRDIGKFVRWMETQVAERDGETAHGKKTEEQTVTEDQSEKRIVTGITKECAIAYKKYLEENYKPDSANSMLVALNGFFAYVGWDDCKVKMIKNQHDHIYSRDKELTRRDYERLVRTARKLGKERLALTMETIAATGIRISELEYVTVQAVRSGKVEIACKGKHREVCLVHDLRRKLLRYCKKEHIRTGSVFVSKYGNPLNRSNIWAEMKRLGKDAGVDVRKVFPHNIRHFFARTYYKMHKNIAWLADILGHSSINTTRIYTATTEAQHIRMLEKLRLVI